MSQWGGGGCIRPTWAWCQLGLLLCMCMHPHFPPAYCVTSDDVSTTCNQRSAYGVYYILFNAQLANSNSNFINRVWILQKKILNLLSYLAPLASYCRLLVKYVLLTWGTSLQCMRSGWTPKLWTTKFGLKKLDTSL